MGQMPCKLFKTKQDNLQADNVFNVSTETSQQERGLSRSVYVTPFPRDFTACSNGASALQNALQAADVK